MFAKKCGKCNKTVTEVYKDPKSDIWRCAKCDKELKEVIYGKRN